MDRNAFPYVPVHVVLVVAVVVMVMVQMMVMIDPEKYRVGDVDCKIDRYSLLVGILISFESRWPSTMMVVFLGREAEVLAVIIVGE